MAKKKQKAEEDEVITVVCSGCPHDNYDDRFIDDGFDPWGNPEHDD